jgi:ribosomal protein S18 acetylase RimI-like enzyme
VDRRLVDAIHRPRITDARLLERYPSHLHINLLRAAQGMGVGRRLMTTLFDQLRTDGSIGVHLGVDPRNDRAIGFYEHLGMRRHDHEGAVLFTRRLVDR